MPRFTSQLEREYFARKTGSTDHTKPLNQMKREYFAAEVGATDPKKPLNELEYEWMVKVITDAGMTPEGNSSELWRQMVLAVSQDPVKYVDQNRQTFYQYAP